MTQNLLKTGLAVCLAFAGAGMSWADGWQRCTTVADVTAGGKFILGYEASPRSGKIIPMKNTGGTATTTAAGYMAANDEEIDMATVSTTTDYEVTIQASTAVTGAVCIKVGDYFIGNTNTKNNCKLFAEESATTAFGVTVGTNDVFTFKIAANSSYHTLQYNTGSPRFACYGGGQKNLVAYKWVTGNVDPTPGPGPDPVLPKVYASLSELVADGTPTTEGVDVTVTLTNEVIKSFYTSSSGNKNGVFLDVNGQEIEIYCYDVPTTWVVGGKISGTVTCPWKLYKSTWELCPTKWDSFTYVAPEGGEGEDGIKSDATLTWNLAADETATVSETFMAWNHADLTMNVEKGGSSTPTNNYYPGVNNYSSTRFYKGSQFTLAPVGSEIVAAEFFATTKDYATALAASAWVNATAKADDKTVTVTPTDGTKAMSAKIGKTTGFTSVKVYYNNLDVVTIDLPASEDFEGHSCNYATFSSDKDVIFDEKDIYGVYAIDVEGEDVVTVDFEGSTAIVKANDVISGYYVPANTGVVLMHLGATTKYYVVAADAANELTAAPAENKLRAASVAMTGDYNFYKFAYNDYAEKSNLGFYWGAEEGAAFYCKPGTAYLALDKTASSNLRGLSLNGNGVVTAIESVAASKANTVIFNLQGQRVSKLQKGVNIVNGKKVIR